MVNQLYKAFKESGGVCTDSRKIIPNTIFFSLSGDQFNGNLFALDALKQGCALAVVDEDREEFKGNDRIVKVESALAMLQSLANHHRRKLKIPIIALTGSNGKTTTKELMHHCLSTQYKCAATEGNLNNHIGVPLTLLKITGAHEVAVIEMGANHRGEIAALCEIAEPDYGLITNIGLAHLEGFGGEEGVYFGKKELFDYLVSTEGTVFVNTDDLKTAKAIGEYSHISYGSSESGAFYRGAINIASKSLEFRWWRADIPEIITEVKTQLNGQFNFSNAMAAVAVSRYFGVRHGQISTAMQHYLPTNHRSQRQSTALGNSVIVDCYNANPSSMKSALLSLAAERVEKCVIVLGDMMELGEASKAEHLKIAQLCAEHLANATVFCVGDFFIEAFETANSSNTQCFANTANMAAHLSQNSITDSTVLLKGSRKMRLETLLPLL